MQVWKFELDIVDEPQQVRMPYGAKVVHVGSQQHGLHSLERWERVCIWAEVNPVAAPVDRWFTVEGTGHPVPHGAAHVGTVVTHDGGLVWHVYEVRTPDLDTGGESEGK